MHRQQMPANVGRGLITIFFIHALIFMGTLQCIGENSLGSNDMDETIRLLPEAYQADVRNALGRAGENKAELVAAIAEAGEDGIEDIAFLIANMPDRDLDALGKNFLLENIRFARRARQETSWGKALLPEIYLNYVLPYVNVNEQRDNWRGDFYSLFMPIAKEFDSASDAALKLNSAVFDTLNVHYHATKRQKPDQSPYESIEIGYASCTGLSILLADACRAVGIPARLVGVPRWTGKRGNHTWVEIWDGEWKFLGASENTPFNKTWFVANAAKADASKMMNRIYAASFKRTGKYFPMIWERSARYVHAIDVTKSYALQTTNADSVMKDCTVITSVSCSEGFSTDSVIDGDIRTAPFWIETLSKDELSKSQFANMAAGGIEYTFMFGSSKKINRIRLFQDEKFCAISYRIVAQTQKDDSFGSILVAVEDKSAPGSAWIEHEFAEITVNALKFQPLVGFGYGPRRFPVLAEFEAYFSDRPKTSADDSTIGAMIHLNRTYEINGFDNIHDTMFSITGATAVSEELCDKYIKPLNLKVITNWPFWGTYKDLPIPEDPEKLGMFDREVVASGKLMEKIKRSVASWEKTRRVGAFANIGLITAPDFMRDTDFKPTVEQSQIESGEWKRLAPPKDPAEWGRWEGEIVRAYNKATNGLIKWVYIWNEPNSGKYLPVPWKEKAERYLELYSGSVPEIKRLNPGLKVGGPVITGAGILGWNKPLQTSGEGGWQNWIKPMIDRNSHLLDHLDVHTYRIDRESFTAEAALVANYCRIKGLAPIPIAASEGAIASGMPNDYDPIAARWRYNTIFWADYILGCLNLPDRVLSQSYFHVWDCASVFGIFDRYNWEPKYARADYNPQPIYWFYWLVRNLRGRRLFGYGDDGVNIVAATQDNRATAVVQNKTGVARTLALKLIKSSDVLINKLDMDFVEYSPISGEIEHGTREAAISDGRVQIPMQPYGLYAVNAELEKPLISEGEFSETDYMGDKVFQRLDNGNSVSFKIALGKDYAESRQFILRFGTSGIPFSRPAVTVDKRVPLIVDINGNKYDILAGKNNELELNIGDIGELNNIIFLRESSGQDDPRIVDPDDFFILSASIAVFARK